MHRMSDGMPSVMGDAHAVLAEEYHRSEMRRDLLHRAKRELADGFLAEAIHDLLHAVEMLSNSEERVMRLHAECYSMIEHAGKILALDAMKRPVVIQLDGPSERHGED